MPGLAPTHATWIHPVAVMQGCPGCILGFALPKMTVIGLNKYKQAWTFREFRVHWKPRKTKWLIVMDSLSSQVGISCLLLKKCWLTLFGNRFINLVPAEIQLSPVKQTQQRLWLLIWSRGDQAESLCHWYANGLSPAHCQHGWSQLACREPRCGYHSAAERVQPSGAAYGASPKPGRQAVNLRVPTLLDSYYHELSVHAVDVDTSSDVTVLFGITLTLDDSVPRKWLPLRTFSTSAGSSVPCKR